MTAKIMEVGDLIEFNSDRQTEKGPSSGEIVEVEKNSDGTPVSIGVRHSDCPKEVFQCNKLSIVKYIIREDGKTVWLCL